MAAAAAVGCGSASGSWGKFRDGNVRKMKGFKVSCVYSAAVGDPYKTLRIHRGASESEVKKAFRKLALRYHPDVCRGNDSGIQFHQINEAYDAVMSNLRGETSAPQMETHVEEEPTRGSYDPDWDSWEEWMGCEGGVVWGYSSPINPYN